MARIGFIGLGIMGRPMAVNLSKAGHSLVVPERASLTEEIRGLASVLPTPADVAAAAEVVILMVPDTPDVEAVGEVIRLWTSRNQRWLSPKFVAGESYGTVRAAALASHLQQRHGLYLNGLLLISSVLDMGTVMFNEGNDLPYSLYLPTYAAIAHYHGKHGDRPDR